LEGWPCFPRPQLGRPGAEFAGVDEEGLFAAVAEAAFDVGSFASRQEPEADGDLRAVEELPGERDHAVHEVDLDEFLPDVALASQALRVSGPFSTCASRIAVAGLVGGSRDCGTVGGDSRSEAETDEVNADHAVRRQVVIVLLEAEVGGGVTGLGAFAFGHDGRDVTRGDGTFASPHIGNPPVLPLESIIKTENGFWTGFTR